MGDSVLTNLWHFHVIFHSVVQTNMKWMFVLSSHTYYYKAIISTGCLDEGNAIL